MPTEVPTCGSLINPTFAALIDLGNSGSNDEICARVIENLKLPNKVVDKPHLGSTVQTELEYQLAWARTYLKKHGAITNSARGIWSITPMYSKCNELDARDVLRSMPRRSNSNGTARTDETDSNAEVSVNSEIQLPYEIRPWRQKLANILASMDPYAFERLSKRLLRECGFSSVEVTKKSGDAGIDGTGKLRINGILSFNVAFQCKRYKGKFPVTDIRDFRGSMSSEIEKGIFITTGVFSSPAKEAARVKGMKQIDLIDGEELLNKLVEYGIGVREIKDYEIDEEYFAKV